MLKNIYIKFSFSLQWDYFCNRKTGRDGQQNHIDVPLKNRKTTKIPITNNKENDEITQPDEQCWRDFFFSEKK